MWFFFFLMMFAVAEMEWGCPDGWLRDSSTTKCYGFAHQKVSSYDNVEEACYKEMAHLGVINTHETLQLVDDIFDMGWRIPKMKFPEDRIWISSHSNKSLSIELHHSNFNISSECLAFVPTRGTQAKFISSMPCEFEKTTPEHILCEKAAEKRKVSMCDKGWFQPKDRNICHGLFQVGVSSADGAEAFCRSHSAKLSTMWTIEERNFIQRIMRYGRYSDGLPSVFPLNQAWLGLKKMVAGGTLVSNNGDYILSRDKGFFFGKGEPNAKSGEQQCFTVGISGNLYDISCDSWQYVENEENIVNHLFCEKPTNDKQAELSPTLPTEKTESCTGNWSIVSNGQKCHKLFQIGVTTMDGAQGICKANGGRLSSLRTVEEVDFVTKLMQRGWKISGNATFYNHVWVSLERSKEDGKWKWNKNDTKIDELGEVLPNSLEVSNCAAFQPMSYLKNYTNFFGEVPCDTAEHDLVYPPSHILCERDHSGPPPTKPSFLQCPDEWHYHEADEMCIKLFVEDAFSYEQAQNRCIAEGGDLVSASTHEKQKFIFDLAKLGWRTRITELWKSVMWVGIRKEGDKFKWLNGDEVEAALFIPPLSDHLNSSCVVMYPTERTLTSLQGSTKGVECEQPLPIEHFMCEKESESKRTKNTRLISRIAVGLILLSILGFVLWSIFRVCYRKKKQEQSEGEYKDPFSFEKLLSPNMPLDSAAPFLPFDQSFVISPKNVELVERIGEGCYGVVWRAIHRLPEKKSSEMDVAVKHVRDTEDIDQRESLAIEITFLSKLGSHPNVIKFIGAITSPKSRHGNMLIMEFCSKGNLRDFLISIKNNSSADDPNLSNFALQIACGMDFISAIPCIHRDLAARNVLLNENFICKINDFGLSKNEDYYKGITSRCLPFRWMAPETIERRRFTLKGKSMKSLTELLKKLRL